MLIFSMNPISVDRYPIVTWMHTAEQGVISDAMMRRVAEAASYTLERNMSGDSTLNNADPGINSPFDDRTKATSTSGDLKSFSSLPHSMSVVSTGFNIASMQEAPYQIQGTVLFLTRSFVGGNIYPHGEPSMR